MLHSAKYTFFKTFYATLIKCIYFLSHQEIFISINTKLLENNVQIFQYKMKISLKTCNHEMIIHEVNENFNMHTDNRDMMFLNLQLNK